VNDAVILQQQELNLNLLAAVRRDRALLPVMIQQGSGVIMHVTSFRSRPSRMPRRKLYSRTAARLFPKEVGPKGVRVVRVSPGWVETTGHGTDRPPGSGSRHRRAGSSPTPHGLAGRIPIGRPAERNEVADLIAFLVSPRAARILLKSQRLVLFHASFRYVVLITPSLLYRQRSSSCRAVKRTHSWSLVTPINRSPPASGEAS